MDVHWLRTIYFPGSEIEKVTEQDELFKLGLQRCTSLEAVLRLLEVPGEEVTQYSAAFALQRLCQLQQGKGSTGAFKGQLGHSDKIGVSSTLPKM